jgi:hypothetical protein
MMSFLSELAQMGLFLFLIAPALVVVLGVSLLEKRSGEQSARRNLYTLMAAVVIALGCLDLLIWTNPYGRRISSSLPALGTLPALVALLALLARKSREIAQQWSTDKLLLAGLGLIGLVLAGFLWVGEPTTFYAVLALTLVLTLAWWAGSRPRGLLLVILSLVCLCILFITGGGAVFTPRLDYPAWVITALQVLAGVGMVLAIFLASALLYISLHSPEGIVWVDAAWRILLAILLVAGSAYIVYWDGVWSSMHARAFEDHLPFAQLLLAMMAGSLLALALPGWRKLTGLAFVFVICAVTIQALLWGWNVSAIELTENRAQRVNMAIERFYQSNGRYPGSLEELTPRYMLYVPPPVIVRLGGWCYQGGQDYYRLGYVSGQFTYQQAVFEAHIFDQAGNIPASGWNCDQMVDKFARGGLNY